jgi:hypothetical protein
VTDEFVVTDELVDRFLREVSDLGNDNPRGWAAGEAVMQRMGWDPSDSRLGNPSSEAASRDRLLYRALAEHCADEYYITKKDDNYWLVAITLRGKGRISGG